MCFVAKPSIALPFYCVFTSQAESCRYLLQRHHSFRFYKVNCAFIPSRKKNKSLILQKPLSPLNSILLINLLIIHIPPRPIELYKSWQRRESTKRDPQEKTNAHRNPTRTISHLRSFPRRVVPRFRRSPWRASSRLTRGRCSMNS